MTFQARAEGGEGASVLSPDAFAAEEPQAAAGADDKSGTAAPDAADVAAVSKAIKATAKKDSVKKEKDLAKSGLPAPKADTVAAAPTEVDEEDVVALDPKAGKSKSRVADTLKATALKPLIARYALQHNLPYGLADAVVRLESRYNAAARNGPNLGLTQVNLRTAQSLGYTGDARGLFDAETNLRYGLKYLAQAYKLAGGDMCGTILRYQFGHRTQTMTNASRVYCAKVKTIMVTSQ